MTTTKSRPSAIRLTSDNLTIAGVTTIIARATVDAYLIACDELKRQLRNPNIVQHPETEARRWIELENHFFDIVVEYRSRLSDEAYISLCDKIEILAGQRFSYRP